MRDYIKAAYEEKYSLQEYEESSLFHTFKDVTDAALKSMQEDYDRKMEMMVNIRPTEALLFCPDEAPSMSAIDKASGNGDITLTAKSTIDTSIFILVEGHYYVVDSKEVLHKVLTQFRKQKENEH